MDPLALSLVYVLLNLYYVGFKCAERRDEREEEICYLAHGKNMHIY